MKEIIGLTETGPVDITYISEGLDADNMFKISDNKFLSDAERKEQETWINIIKMQKKIVVIIGTEGDMDEDEKPHRSDHVHINKNSVQYQGVIALMIINRLIMMGKFNVLSKIYEHIVDKYMFNLHKLKYYFDNIDIAKKKEIVEWLIRIWNNDLTKFNNEYDNIADQNEKLIYLEKQFKRLTTYDTSTAPFEGMFINENIIGLIKVLVHNVMGKDDNDISNVIKKQDVSTDFDIQRKKLRIMNGEMYSETQKTADFEPYENIFRDISKIKEIDKINRETYKSDRIYNYDHPSIEKIIEIYMKERTIDDHKREPVKIAKVKDFKIFYLFTNDDNTKKCHHQLKLLDNTKKFIELIDA